VTPKKLSAKTTLTEIATMLSHTRELLKRRWLRSIKLRLLGASLIEAAKLARVPRATFQGWMRLVADNAFTELESRWDRLVRQLKPLRRERPKGRSGQALRVSIHEIEDRLSQTGDLVRRRHLRSIKLILLGATVGRAQRFARVGESTFEKWLRVARTSSLDALFKPRRKPIERVRRRGK
jgi:uncharacterized ferritin-like protein (DUF455 family)